MEFLIVIGLLYLAYNSGALAQFGIPGPVGQVPASTVNMAPSGLQPNASITAPATIQPLTVPPAAAQPLPNQPTLSSTSLGVTGSGVTGVIAGISGFGNSAAPGAQGVVAAVGSSIAASGAGFLAGGPIGAVVAGVTALITALANGHKVRMQQATSENTATNLGVQGYDQGLQQINAAYNARTISESEAIQLVQQVMSYFWQEVTPHIQPGRNGCNGGSACPPWPASGNGCTGSIGAACCVGCYDLAGGNSPSTFPGMSGPMYFGILGTIAVLQNGGGPVYYQAVIGSKYGGQNRPAYVLNWVQVAAG